MDNRAKDLNPINKLDSFDEEFDKFYLKTVSSLRRTTDDVNYSSFQSDQVIKSAQNVNKRKSIATEPISGNEEQDVKKIKLEPEFNDQEFDVITLINSPVKRDPLSKIEPNKYYDLFYSQKVKNNALNKIETASVSKKSNVDNAKKPLYSEEKRYAMKMIKQVFAKNELKTGHFPDILGKCLSKTRVPFDSNKIRIVKESLVSRFSLTEIDLEKIWYSIRSNLNMKITKMPRM